MSESDLMILIGIISTLFFFCTTIYCFFKWQKTYDEKREIKRILWKFYDTNSLIKFLEEYYKQSLNDYVFMCRKCKGNGCIHCDHTGYYPQEKTRKLLKELSPKTNSDFYEQAVEKS